MEKLKKNARGLYEFPRASFDTWAYKHMSFTYPGRWAAYLPGCGTVLYIEGLHFEIVG